MPSWLGEPWQPTLELRRSKRARHGATLTLASGYPEASHRWPCRAQLLPHPAPVPSPVPQKSSLRGCIIAHSSILTLSVKLQPHTVSLFLKSTCSSGPPHRHQPIVPLCGLSEAGGIKAEALKDFCIPKKLRPQGTTFPYSRMDSKQNICYP